MRLGFAEEPQLIQTIDGRSILVVDDEIVIRDLCSKVLKGYRILQAGNGEEALKMLERESVDIVLTDVMMPRMNGLDLLRQIKERLPNQLVVVMTGYADKEVILRALKADADDFINKPINLLQLKTTIDKVLEKKALKDELIHLKRMDRLKSDFLGLVSHKLKTPITAISLFIQNLARGVGGPGDAAFEQTLQLILEESNYLGYLIQDLLNYSDVILQEGLPQRELVDLGDLILKLLVERGGTAESKGVELTCTSSGPLPQLSLDRKRITFAIQALLDNAIKFTPSGGRVTLSSRVTADEIHLVVQDSGCGIPREELPKVFEKFYQVDPERTGQVRGFGLGLYYARLYVQDHGGSVRLESQPGLGTTVTLILPRD
ncbi:HAMP domain-containing sensor histidine kinase [Desulfuromonas carbonis]|uniref:sensor histidine kinase n=1 Tax=Desulfuromonas sp. DDH964 TaxID=1823759 RepID=UPI00078DABCA|nr:response regulator [Desulfuromonas sp. DDH964]AMV71298.1 motility response receiver histidine kinase [Desulfuromonas sp. DDH964]